MSVDGYNGLHRIRRRSADVAAFHARLRAAASPEGKARAAAERKRMAARVFVASLGMPSTTKRVDRALELLATGRAEAIVAEVLRREADDTPAVSLPSA